MKTYDSEGKEIGRVPIITVFALGLVIGWVTQYKITYYYLEQHCKTAHGGTFIEKVCYQHASFIKAYEE